MNTMRCIEITNPGKNSKLNYTKRPIPVPSKGEVLIKIHAAGINRPDLIQRMGHYPPPKGVTDIPGLEVSGEIVDPNGCTEFKKGDHVMALIAGGGYAEYCIAPVQQVLSLPSADTDMISAAAIPETFFTVWTNFFDSGKLQKGETVLIHGGTSGIGTTAIQIAKLYDCTVITTAGSDEKCEACRKLGADIALNYRTQDFVDEAQGHNINLILDMVGGDYLAKNIDCLAPFGRHVSIAALNGKNAEVDILKIMRKRLILTGSTLRARSPDEKGKIKDALQKNIWPALAAGTIKPVIDSVFDFNDADNAHKKMQQSTHIGKIVLRL